MRLQNILQKLNITNYRPPGLRVWRRGGFGDTYRDWGRTEQPVDFSVMQPFGSVSDWSKSSDLDPAYLYHGVVFIDRGTFVEFGSKSRLKNSSVWRHQR